MPTIKTPIIPVEQKQFVLPNQPHEPDLKAICVFAAIGFFLDQDTFWQDRKVLKPGSINELSDDGQLISSESYFQWHYEPRDISFDKAVDEFTELFETIIDEQIGDQQAILPLSGGLDSRSQAVALKHLNKPTVSYSYSFDGGYNESGIGKQIADVCGFPFQHLTVDKGYMWDKIDHLVHLARCGMEFTHARQLAALDDFKKMEGVFSLGHWGDVLFDRGIAKGKEEVSEFELLSGKMVKKGGMELANALWQEWGLEGRFKEYLDSRFHSMLKTVEIKNKSARIRAYKSLHWAYRWTSINLAVFEDAHPITLPYYDNRMCEFICSVPEEHLADRKIQIAYIKRRNPAVAKITWQDHRPFNLYNFSRNREPYNLPYRAFNKGSRVLSKLMGKKIIQRNWELQFLGEHNQNQLKDRLFSEDYNHWVSKQLKEDFLSKFNHKDPVYYSHSVSTLLTIGEWYKQLRDE